MSSIAYVTDEKMIEYHRLCGNRRINFWRLTSHKEFTNFHPGELLFFYTRPNNSRKNNPGPVTRASHADSMKKVLPLRIVSSMEPPYRPYK